MVWINPYMLVARRWLTVKVDKRRSERSRHNLLDLIQEHHLAGCVFFVDRVTIRPARSTPSAHRSRIEEEGIPLCSAWI
jgi:hypothetical protein